MSVKSYLGFILAGCFIGLACKPNKSAENPALATDNILTEQEISAGWKLLFDGKTLEGWRMYQNKAADAWSVKDGELYCKDRELSLIHI